MFFCRLKPSCFYLKEEVQERRYPATPLTSGERRYRYFKKLSADFVFAWY
jgi:hypothetical protein